MTSTIQELKNRKSTRAFEQKEIPVSVKEAILEAAFQAPTAGNQMLYSILDITDQGLKDKLSVTCDNQPFIAKAPMVLIFLADTRRWLDSYRFAGQNPRNPGVGDLLLACQDAVIAAQNAVVAAESLGVGSCYIGDILENAEEHISLLQLEEFVLPISMLVFGYPTEQQKERTKLKRFEKQYIVHENHYRRLSEEEHREMFQRQTTKENFDFNGFLEMFCNRKYESSFAKEMSRSSEVYLKQYLTDSILGK